MLSEFCRLVAALILLTIFQILLVGCLWVLRVVIDWWLDIDYVEKLKQFIRKRSD